MSILRRFPAVDCFIETGFGHGQTLTSALQQPFKTLHSIEIDWGLIALMGERFTDPRVHLHHGSSPTILPSLCQPALSTCFWLDAHYSAGQYTSSHEHDLRMLDPAVGQCALLQELAIIRAVPWEILPWILIDDAYCIKVDVYEGMFAPYDRLQYPTEAEIAEALPAGYVLELCDEGTGWYYCAAPPPLTEQDRPWGNA